LWVGARDPQRGDDQSQRTVGVIRAVGQVAQRHLYGRTACEAARNSLKRMAVVAGVDAVATVA